MMRETLKLKAICQIYLCMYTYADIYMYIIVYIYIYHILVYIYIYILVYVYIYVYILVYVYIYTCIHIYTYANKAARQKILTRLLMMVKRINCEESQNGGAPGHV